MTDLADLTPLEKLGDARAIVRKKTPYFRKAVLSLVPVATPKLGTVGCTERYVLMYDPEFVNQTPVAELAGVLVHEISHLLRGHHKRIRQFPDPKRGNIAGDLAMNPDIRDMGFKLPSEVVMPAHFGFREKLYLEEYYNLLPESPDDDEGDDEGDGDGEEKPKKKGKTTAGHCGSCAGNAHENEPQNEGLGRTEAEVERIKRETAESVKDWVSRKGQGSVPDSWNRWAEVQLGEEKVPWQQVLAKKIKRAVAFRPGANTSSYIWPNRHQAAVGYGPGKPILAGIKNKVPHVCVVIDTSGSMGAKDIEDAITETHGILKAIGAEIEFISADVGIAAISKIRQYKQLSKLIKGGGGTDFRPVFTNLESRPQKRRPEVLVYITDGGGYAPDKEPNWCRTIWVLIGKHQMKPLTSTGPINWGEILEVK